MKPDITTHILGKIKSKNLKPRPKIYFIVWNIVFWCLYIITLFIGSIGIGIIFSFLSVDDIWLIQRVGFLLLLSEYLPFFWIASVTLLIILSFFIFKKTDNGYKYTPLKLIVLNIVLTFIWGSLLFLSGFSQKCDTTLRYYFHSYNSVLVQDREERVKEIWQNEEKWLLLWIILSVNKENFTLQDTNNKIWTISHQNAQIKRKVTIQIWEKVKIVWEISTKESFKAENIRPYFGQNHSF